jgi:hypothetical protein
VTNFKNGLRSAAAFRNENGSGADYLDERARGGTLRLGRTGLGGYVKFAVKWPYFAKITPEKKIVPSKPHEKTHKHPKHKKRPSYNENKNGQSYGRL